MSSYLPDPFAAASLQTIAVDVYTAAYRVSGISASRFSRVADILNQVVSTHLMVEQATVSEYADPTATLSAQQVLMTLDEILFVVINDTDHVTRAEMRIPKRAVRAQVGLPPFRISGSLHVAQGSRPVDGLLNVAERFVPITDATISSAAHPELGRSVTALAIQRSRAHIMLVADDDRPDKLLADVLDQETAERWLHKPEESGS
ncbi:MAG TPA: hypothetical protein VK600_03740 [Candidatus Saccharimonadales bacterium]|nr:hypothetical protein [Candidatus Saccharimonadales bacterium]